MSGWLLFAVALAAAVLATLLRTVDLGGPFRNASLAVAAGRLRNRNPRPESVERTYWTGDEYKKDAARLELLGYEVISEAATNPFVAGAPFGGRPGRTIRVPVAHVMYELRSPRVI
jgi:hypothetical protein